MVLGMCAKRARNVARFSHVFDTFNSVRKLCVNCAFYVRFMCALNVLELCMKCV